VSKIVKFISYNGSYPNLCSGDLVIEVNGKIYELTDHPLSSGGSVRFDSDWNEHISSGEWSVTVPNELKDYEEEITDIVNSNVRCGCCGGCV
jgi:hypothetical protein